VEIVNPESPLATLDNEDARLDMVLTIEKGRGYITAEGRESPIIGVIPIDAVFTPVRRVNYRVEKTRVGARTDYDKLMLEIQTDGSIGPSDALAEAAQILIDQFQIFATLGGDVQRPEKGAVGPGPIPSRLQDMAIEVLDLSSRTYNCLKRSQITTVGQLLQMSEDELLSLRNFGQKSLQELHEKLSIHGIVAGDGTGEGRAFTVVDDLDVVFDTNVVIDVDQDIEEELEEELEEDLDEDREEERTLARTRPRRGRGAFDEDEPTERRRR
jgi:DNA-directed RNA polymerase alpha subunit